MNVAVTGGAGFIGRVLIARLLKQGHSVRVLSRRESPQFPAEVETFFCDLTSARDEVLRAFVQDVDVLYHCAGEVNDASRMYATHVTGTRQLALASVGRIKRWVQLSSVGVYGPVSQGTVDELQRCNPQGVYEETKAEADAVVWEFFQNKAFELSILRPSNVYGRDMSHRYIFQLIGLIDKGLFFFIGDKNRNRMSNIHVENVVDALILCGTKEEANGQIFNLSDDLSIKAYVEAISQALDRRGRYPSLPEFLMRALVRVLDFFPGSLLTTQRVNVLTSKVSYSSVKIEQMLGYTHRISIQEGLAELALKFRKDG